MRGMVKNLLDTQDFQREELDGLLDLIRLLKCADRLHAEKGILAWVAAPLIEHHPSQDVLRHYESRAGTLLDIRESALMFAE
jgi:hypothetical protein